MRITLPATGAEVVISEKSLLISRMSVDGLMTWVNPEFLRVSGFPSEALLGQPYEKLRNPDMPPEIWGELWGALQRGRPWTGLLKNRAQTGRYYWTDTTIIPVTENGSISEYLSLQTKASVEAIRQAEHLYRLLNRGKMKYDTSTSHALLDRLSLTRRLSGFLVMGAAVVMAALCAIAGWKLDSLLEERTLSSLSQQLESAQLLVSQSVTQTMANVGRSADHLAAEMGETKGLEVKTAELERFANRSGMFVGTLVKEGSGFVLGFLSSKKWTASGSVVFGAEAPASGVLESGGRYVGSARIGELHLMGDFRPLKDSAGKVAGTIFVGLDVDQEFSVLKERLRSAEIMEGGQIYVIDTSVGSTQGNLVVHATREGHNVLDILGSQGRDLLMEMLLRPSGEIRYNGPDMVERVAILAPFQPLDWLLVGEIDAQALHLPPSFIYWVAVTLVLSVVVLLWAFFVALLRRQLVIPLASIQKVLLRMAEGDFSNKLDVRRPDEIGDLMRAVIVMQTRASVEKNSDMKARGEKADLDTPVSEVIADEGDSSGSIGVSGLEMPVDVDKPAKAEELTSKTPTLSLSVAAPVPPSLVGREIPVHPPQIEFATLAPAPSLLPVESSPSAKKLTLSLSVAEPPKNTPDQ